MTNPLVPLLQLSDSNFPSGAFSHSFGFETYIQENVISDKDSFAQALIVFLQKQLVFTDGLAFKLAYEAIEEVMFSEVLELDHILYTNGVAKETREGNRRIGEQMAKLAISLYPSPVLERYLECIQNKEGYGHTAVVFAAVFHHLQISKTIALETYLFSTISSMVQNGVRGIPIGQSEGQKILVSIQPYLKSSIEKIIRLSKEDLGAGIPGLEIAQMHHERLHVRLFMS